MHEIRRIKITPFSLAPALEQQVTTRVLGHCVPTPKTTIIGISLITPYTSQPLIRLHPARRVYEGRPLGTICNWKQVNQIQSYEVTDSQRYTIARVG